MSATLVTEIGESLNKLNYSVIIEQEKEGSYKATVWGLPEIQATGDTKEAALTSVHQLLTARLEKAEVVFKEIALPDSENPWLKFSGMYKDNPLFNDVEIKALKNKIFGELLNTGKTTIGEQMMPKSKSYHEDLIQSLKDPSEAVMYIKITIEEGEVEMLRKALKNVVEAHEKMNNISEKTKVLHEKLDRMLSERKGEKIYCLSALLEALGFHLSVTDSKVSNN